MKTLLTSLLLTVSITLTTAMEGDGEAYSSSNSATTTEQKLSPKELTGMIEKLGSYNVDFTLDSPFRDNYQEINPYLQENWLTLYNHAGAIILLPERLKKDNKKPTENFEHGFQNFKKLQKKQEEVDVAFEKELTLNYFKFKNVHEEGSSIKINLSEIGGQQFLLPTKIFTPHFIENTTRLFIQNCNILFFPKEVGCFKRLYFLHAWNNKISYLPAELGLLTTLLDLEISENFISDIPGSFINLTDISSLGLQSNSLNHFPHVICALKTLESLTISKNNISSLPNGIKQLTMLSHLNVSDNNLKDLPNELFELPKLIHLRIHNIRDLRITPEQFKKTNLKFLGVKIEDLDTETQNILKGLDEKISIIDERR